jgi:hypothetical protein
MRRFILASSVASLVMSCGPEAAEEPVPRGALEFEHSYVRIYREDRYVDVVLVEQGGERRECGTLSERVYDELEDTLAGLDPRVNYGYDSRIDECIEPPGAEIHIEGFEHSPFSCDFLCCRQELARAALIYMLLETYFSDGEVLVFDGEPYVVVEQDEQCS